MLLGQVEQTELWDLAEEAAGLSPSCHRLGGGIDVVMPLHPHPSLALS